MKYWFPCVLKPVRPSTRNTICGIAPAELIDKLPSPLSSVRNDQILHVKIALPFVRVLLDIQKVRPVLRHDSFNVCRNGTKPLSVPGGPDWPESTERVVLSLARIWRRCD